MVFKYFISANILPVTKHIFFCWKLIPEEISLPAVVKLINAEFHFYSHVCYYRTRKRMLPKIMQEAWLKFSFYKSWSKKYKIYLKIQSWQNLKIKMWFFKEHVSFYLNISSYFYILLYICNYCKSYKYFSRYWNVII